MPRPSYASKHHRVFLPRAMLDALHLRAEKDQTPVAELLRRIIDLAVTFAVPTPDVQVPPIGDFDTPAPFTMIIPQPMLDELNSHAAVLEVAPDEVIRRTTWVYLRRRRRVADTQAKVA
jgi:hypothetical protein